MKDDSGLEVSVGSRAKLILYYEGSKNTIYTELKGAVTDEKIFTSDCGRVVCQDTFDNYDVAKFVLL